MKNLKLSSSRFGGFASSRTKLAVFLAIVLVAVTMFLGSPSIHAQGGGFVSGIEGSWLATITIQGGPPPFQAIATYGSRGSLVVTDSGVPPGQGNVYQGSWVRTGGNEVTFTFLGFQFDAAGSLSGYIRAHETIRGE